MATKDWNYAMNKPWDGSKGYGKWTKKGEITRKGNFEFWNESTIVIDHWDYLEPDPKGYRGYGPSPGWDDHWKLLITENGWARNTPDFKTKLHAIKYAKAYMRTH